jgi:hypothetical protein
LYAALLRGLFFGFCMLHYWEVCSLVFVCSLKYNFCKASVFMFLIYMIKFFLHPSNIAKWIVVRWRKLALGFVWKVERHVYSHCFALNLVIAWWALDLIFIYAVTLGMALNKKIVVWRHTDSCEGI